MSLPIPTAASNAHKPAGTPVNPESVKDVKLFQPFTQKFVKIHNHIGVSPMCMYAADDGHFNDFHIMHYGSLAIKGPGLIIIEASGVVPEGRITPQCGGLWKDSQIEGLKRVVGAIKSQGSTPGLQIAHAGRKASMSPPFKGDYVEGKSNHGWPKNVYAPSAIPFAEHYPEPIEMTKEDIKRTVQAFADAAVRADKAGIEVLEIHAAHGYLISTFLSGSSNKRTDEYGGSFENRSKFALEVVAAVRKVWHSKPLWVRISCTEYSNPEPMGENADGWDIFQAIELAKEFKKLGVDVVDCSSGGIVQGVEYPRGIPMYQVQFAEAIKKEASIATAAVGLIVEGEDAESILQDEKADFILAGREFLRDSAFVLVAAQALNVAINWPQQYSWAVKSRRNTSKAATNKNSEFMTTIP
ncbi:conserved hypothetical protein [Mucor ambiguus]|uniref:NADH:flavin oxidoreductase/NADH oxidase N-terminal domain-containing protein n=1 Tax=Mucor ambiguus TaxID=91626 RepID=A0A0C9MZU1_9FUNG|nr:conserved hypothetical protein [Mucor ambiguus]